MVRRKSIRNIDLLGDTITYVEGRTYKYKQMGADFGFYDECGNIYAGRTQFVSDLTEALNTINPSLTAHFLCLE